MVYIYESGSNGPSSFLYLEDLGTPSTLLAHCRSLTLLVNGKHFNEPVFATNKIWLCITQSFAYHYPENRVATDPAFFCAC